jgi:hypothetical protein
MVACQQGLLLGGALARDNLVGGGGGGCIFIYSCSHTVKIIAFKINTSDRTRIYEYASPPPIIGLAKALLLYGILNIRR